MQHVHVFNHVENYIGKRRTVKDYLFCKCAQACSKEIGLSDVAGCSVVQHVIHATLAAFPYFSWKPLYKRVFEG